MKISLRALRINAGLTLKQACNKLGISTETLRSYEHNKTHPDFKRLSEILNLYNVKYGDVVYSDDCKELVIGNPKTVWESLKEIHDKEEKEIENERENIMITDQKEYYDLIRKDYKKANNTEKIPNFMKVYYEIERANSYEMNKFYYAVCNYIYLGIMPKKEILGSENWENIKTYAIEERKKVLEANGEV